MSFSTPRILYPEKSIQLSKTAAMNTLLLLMKVGMDELPEIYHSSRTLWEDAKAEKERLSRERDPDRFVPICDAEKHLRKNFSPGLYNHTIIVTDTFGNVAVETVFVTVVDTTPPQLDPPLDMVYEEGVTGNQIVWTASDLNPYEYTVTGNATMIDWTPWTNGAIMVDVDGLTPGVYNYTIVVKDYYGNWVSDIVIVTVVDMTLPEVNNPDDFTYEQGSSGNEFVWIVGDLTPVSEE